MVPRIAFLLLSLLAVSVSSFVMAPGMTGVVRSTSLSSTTEAKQDDLLKPAYEIEPITIRVGHGFDIHRMAPIEDAGQPIVIGGVTITHKDQKVRQI